ncbi:hypothetical protein ES703_112328 [subsurface metagenome]
MSVEEGSTYPTSVSPGGSMWLDVYLRYNKMPSWDFNLTATNADGTSTISKTISPSVPGEPYTQVTDFIIPESLPAGATIGELTVVAKNTGEGAGYLVVGINSEDYTEVMGSSPTKVAVGGTFTFYLTLGINPNMPNEDFTLTATNQDGTSYITKTITLELAKIPTIISIGASPNTGAPPYTTLIEGELYGEDGSAVSYANVNLYRDEVKVDSTSTDAWGFYSFTQVITEPHDFYTEFEGNDKYEGCA